MVICTQNSFTSINTRVDVPYACTLMAFVIFCGSVHIGYMGNNTKIDENNGCLHLKKRIHQHVHVLK